MATPKPEQKKKSDLGIRTVTGLTFGAVMIAGIVAHLYTFVVLMGLVMILSLREFYAITKKARGPSKVTGWYLPTVTIAALLIYFTALGDSYGHLEAYSINVSFTFLLPALFLLFFVLELFSGSKNTFQNIGHHMVSFVYLVFPFTLLIYLTHGTDGYDWRPLLGIILLIWGNDSGAYLVGRKLGRTKLWPRISPGKTVEGSAGGMLASVLAAIALSYIIPVNGWELYDWIVIALLASIFATFGDLVESMLKRNLNIKDSGTLLPGHGGILDRFDAFYFTIPVVVAYLVLRGLIVG